MDRDSFRPEARDKKVSFSEGDLRSLQSKKPK